MNLFIAAAAMSFSVAAFHIADALMVAPHTSIDPGTFGLLSPALQSLVWAAMFTLWGLYALAAAHRIGRLPFMRHALYGIGGAYFTRGLLSIPQLFGYNLFSADVAVTTPDLLLSFLALAIGVLHLLALELRARACEKNHLHLLTHPHANAPSIEMVSLQEQKTG